MRFFFALFSLFRFGISFGLLHRPITIGLLWWLVSGDPYTALGIACFFELFVLDLIAVGTVIPLNPLLPLFWVLCIAVSVPVSGAAELSVLVIFSLPLMQVGEWVERRQRARQERGYTEMLGAHTHGEDVGEAAARAVHRSMIQLAGANFVAFMTAGTLWYVLYSLTAHIVGHVPRFTPSLWNLVFAFAALGAILAIRIKQGYVVFGMLILVLSAYAFMGAAL